MEIKKISYSNSTDDKVKQLIEYIVEKVISEELDITNKNKVELHVSKYLSDENSN